MTFRFKLEFEPCETCAAQPGTPVLCRGCRNNRAVIAKLARQLSPDGASAAGKRFPRCTCTDVADADIECPLHGR